MTRGQGSKRKDTRVRLVRRLTAGWLHHCAPAWSPDGHILCFTLGRGADSHWLLTDRKGRAARVLPGPVVGGASVAADHSVAYGRQVGATAELWLLPPTGAPPQRLLGGDGRLYRDPAFSPDGRFLCYAADDGPSGGDSPLRLWMVDLSNMEHTLLVSTPPTIEGAAGPARIGRPVFTADGNDVLFDVQQGEQVAIGIVALTTKQAQLLTGPGFARPAPVGNGLLCVEHIHKDGQSAVCLLRYRALGPALKPASAEPAEPTAGQPAAGFKLRSAPVAGLPEGAHEPAVAVGKRGAVHLACAAPGRTRGGEPQRYDVHVGRLSRLPATGLRRSAERPQPVADASPADDAGTVERQAAAAAAGLAAAPGEHAVPQGKRRSRRRRHEKAAATSEPAHDEVTHGDEAPADAERGV